VLANEKQAARDEIWLASRLNIKKAVPGIFWSRLNKNWRQINNVLQN
jgi:hypothetical protein